MTRTLGVRLDAMGDVLLTGPALRAMAACSDHLTLLTGPRGDAAARLLPGVDDVHVWACPWIEPEPPPVEAADIDDLIAWLRSRAFDRAVIFTSFHQDPLPLALALRMAGVPWIGAISEDYPGSLLDLRHQSAGPVPETERALSLARASGCLLDPDDDGRLRLTGLRREPGTEQPYVVLHPGTSVPARAWPADRFVDAARLLDEAGRRVVVTGAPDEVGLTRQVAAFGAVDLGGRTSLPELADIFAGADVVVCGNTGPGHLAAAVDTPVVSLFAPTVPATQWAPYGVRVALLGDQSAPCRDSRAVTCDVPGHPCLTSVEPSDVVAAVEQLAPVPELR